MDECDTPNFNNQGKNRSRINKIPLKSEIESIEASKFAKILELDDISYLDVQQSISLEENRKMVFQSGQGAGLSGSFFFFSRDNRFIIKTLRGEEKNILVGMLDDFIEHIIQTDNKSLLMRIYGLFTIKTNRFAPIDVIVMQNTSKLQNKSNPKMLFDFKGSTINRSIKFKEDEQKFWLDELNQKKVMKDLNYIEINKDFDNQLMQLTQKQ